MGRHRTPDEKRELGERARALRAAGRSQREILAELRIGDDLLRELVRGTPLPDSLRRPRAKDALRATAVELRLEGRTYDEIAAELGVSKASCSLWLRHLPHPGEDPERRVATEARRTSALRDRARRDREDRDALGRAEVQAAAESMGCISGRDLLTALAVSYWCEGAKRKPWNRQERVSWMNSDPMLVRLFLEGLRLAGITHERLVLRVSIHERADEASARRWWSAQTGVSLEQFRKSTIKRHNPKTVRYNVNEGYHGCLTVTVLQGAPLYRQLAGWMQGLAEQPRQQPEWQDVPVGLVHRRIDGEDSSALV